jgi:hypothetical protein
VIGLSGELSGEGSSRVLYVFRRVVWIEILGFRSTLLSPFLHNTGLTIGFTGVLQVPRRSTCCPPPPPHRRVAFTHHSPVFPYHVGRRFSDDLVLSCWRLLPPLTEALFWWFCCCICFLDAVSGHLRLWACCCRI